MTLNRRALLGSLGGAAALAAFRSDAFARITDATKAAAGKSPATLASDEAFWIEIAERLRRRPHPHQSEQRRMQPGARPRPRAADPGHPLLQRDPRLPHVDRARASHRVLPPRARRRVRLRSGGDGDHAQRLGIPRDPHLRHRPQGRRRGDPDQPELRPHDHVLGTARPPRRDRRQADLLPRAAALLGPDRRALPRGDHAEDPGHRGDPHHEPHRPDPPGARDRAHGPREEHRSLRGRRARVLAVPVQAGRPRVRLLRHEPPQVALRPDRDGLSLRPQEQTEVDLAAHGGASGDGREHPQVRGDRHPPRRQPQCHRRRDPLQPRDRGRPQGRPPALPAGSLGASACGRRSARQDPDARSTTRTPARSRSFTSTASTPRSSRPTCGTSTAS